MSYRNPAYLAKVAATGDIISGGRVEMGIGGGWYEHEWRAYGYGFPSAGERLGTLDEGVQIMRQAWSTARSLRRQALPGRRRDRDPEPLQDGGIPLWIAGGGEKVTLKIAAKYAQYTNFDGTPEGFAHKSELLRGHCGDVGTDFDAIVRSANYNVAIGRDRGRGGASGCRIRAPPAAERRGGAGRAMRSARSAGRPRSARRSRSSRTLSALQRPGVTYAILYFPEAAYDRSGSSCSSARSSRRSPSHVSGDSPAAVSV